MSCHIFQSTHPLRGATRQRHLHGAQVYISIHAPLAGCDDVHIKCSKEGNYFNPRTPCGVRPVLKEMVIPQKNFNPRTPCGVRRARRSKTASGRHFNPRTPCGVRHAARQPVKPLFAISIHAPLAGCDVGAADGLLEDGEFQSTHPLRGATGLAGSRRLHKRISIHAPLAGCDIPTRGGRYLLRRISIHAPLAGCDKGRTW